MPHDCRFIMYTDLRNRPVVSLTHQASFLIKCLSYRDDYTRFFVLENRKLCEL